VLDDTANDPGSSAVRPSSVRRAWFYFILILLITSVWPSRAAGQARYRLLLDGSLSPVTGAHAVLSLHRGLYRLEDRYLGTRWFDERNPGLKIAGVSIRLVKTIGLDYVADYMGFLVQHEFFGHGARYREFGFTENRFSLHFPPPFGDGEGWAFRGRPAEGRRLSSHEHLTMISGGSEANTVLSLHLRGNWLHRGDIHYRESLLYLFTSNDLAAYILRTKAGLRKEAGNDILAYLRALNGLEGYPSEADYRLSVDDLARAAWINLLNPFPYFALYAFFKSYLWSGEENFRFPMIRVGRSGGYLPAFRMGLTPFGPELFWENLYADRKTGGVYGLTFRYGMPAFHDFWGFGVEAEVQPRGRLFIVGARLDVWNQPALTLGGESLESGKAGWGGAVIGRLFYRVLGERSLLHLAAELGYKTSGYLEGERLSGGWILRVGLGFSGL